MYFFIFLEFFNMKELKSEWLLCFDSLKVLKNKFMKKPKEKPKKKEEPLRYIGIIDEKDPFD